MAIIHRAYKGADDLHKMQSMNAEAVAEVGYDGYVHVGDIPHRIYNGLRHFDPTELVRLWEDWDGKLLGWVAVYPNMMFFDMQVIPSLRGNDMHVEMAQWATKQAQEWKVKLEKSDNIAAEVIGKDSTTIAVLEQCGFTLGKHSLNITLRSLAKDIPSAQFPEGFTIRCVEGIHEAEKLVDVHSKSFGSSWTPELYRYVMESPGYSAENEIIVVAPDGRFAAFCVTWYDTLNKVALFEPVGTHEDFRRLGLARNMMLYTLAHMKAKGMKQAMVGHELENPASTKLYASLGFKTACEIVDYHLSDK